MHAFQLGQFYVEPAKGSISDGEKSVTIEPKAMAVLCELKSNQGEVMSQQTLFTLVWPDRIFSPSSLQRVIAIIRKALNETSQNPTFLFTHPKLGYRLEVPSAPQIDHTSNIETKIANNTANIVKITAAILMAVLIIFLLGRDLITEDTPSVSLIPITFGQQAEFNSKLSNGGEYVSYQSKSAPNALFLSNLTNLSNVRQFDFKHPVVDYIWRNQSLLVLTQNAQSLFSLFQLQVDKQPSQKLIVELSQWNKISELAMGDSGYVWFIGQYKNKQEYVLVRQDLVSYSHKKFLELGDSVISSSLSASPQGLYFHYFNGTENTFGLINHEGQTEYLDVNTPDIVDLHWHQQSTSLLLSNQLTSELYAMQKKELKPIHLPTNEVLKDISSSQNTLVATLVRQDMDIVRWHHGDKANSTFKQQIAKRPVESKPMYKKAIDTKFADYQASFNNKRDIAFLSTRNGKPQVFIRDNNQTYLAFENHQNIPFIPPLVWSPLGEQLAFVVQNKIHIHNIQTKQTKALDIKEEIARVMSWSLANSLILKLTNNEFIEYNLTTQKTKVLGFNGLNFLAKDADGNWLGVSAEALFWADQKISFDQALKFAFYQDQHLIIHAKSASGNKLDVYNNQLDSVFSSNLDATCHYLTGIDLSDLKNVSWLCTKLEANDSEVVLVENLNLEL